MTLDAEPTHPLGASIRRRWRRPGPPAGRMRPALIGSLAGSSVRFAEGMGRPVMVRRATMGPARSAAGATARGELSDGAGGRGAGPARSAVRTSDLAARPPRWWREVSAFGESLASATPDDAAVRAAATAPRGLTRVVKPMPTPSEARPTGSWASTTPKVVPMRLPAEVAAVGNLTTAADRAPRRIARSPGPVAGIDGGTANDRTVPASQTAGASVPLTGPAASGETPTADGALGAPGSAQAVSSVGAPPDGPALPSTGTAASLQAAASAARPTTASSIYSGRLVRRQLAVRRAVAQVAETAHATTAARGHAGTTRNAGSSRPRSSGGAASTPRVSVSAEASSNSVAPSTHPADHTRPPAAVANEHANAIDGVPQTSARSGSAVFDLSDAALSLSAASAEADSGTSPAAPAPHRDASAAPAGAPREVPAPVRRLVADAAPKPLPFATLRPHRPEAIGSVQAGLASLPHGARPASAAPRAAGRLGAVWNPRAALGAGRAERHAEAADLGDARPVAGSLRPAPVSGSVRREFIGGRASATSQPRTLVRNVLDTVAGAPPHKELAPALRTVSGGDSGPPGPSDVGRAGAEPTSPSPSNHRDGSASTGDRGIGAAMSAPAARTAGGSVSAPGYVQAAGPGHAQGKLPGGGHHTVGIRRAMRTGHRGIASTMGGRFEPGLESLTRRDAATWATAGATAPRLVALTETGGPVAASSEATATSAISPKGAALAGARRGNAHEQGPANQSVAVGSASRGDSAANSPTIRRKTTIGGAGRPLTAGAAPRRDSSSRMAEVAAMAVRPDSPITQDSHDDQRGFALGSSSGIGTVAGPRSRSAAPAKPGTAAPTVISATVPKLGPGGSRGAESVVGETGPGGAVSAGFALAGPPRSAEPSAPPFSGPTIRRLARESRPTVPASWTMAPPPGSARSADGERTTAARSGSGPTQAGPPAPSSSRPGRSGAGRSGPGKPAPGKPARADGISAPIVRRWDGGRPTRPGGTNRPQHSNGQGGDMSIGSHRFTSESAGGDVSSGFGGSVHHGTPESPATQHDDQTVASLTALVDARLDEVLEPRVRRILDERIVEENERWSWRSDRGAF